MLRTVFAMMCFVAVSAAPTFKPNSNLDEHLSSLSHTITKTQTVCTDKKGAGWCATKMTADKCEKGSGQKNCMVHCGVCSSEGATPPAPAAATVVPTWELPEPPAGTITRKNVLKMDEDEQSRFAYSVLKMVENGDFFEAAKLHAATGEYCPHGGQEHFAYWHRLHILSFEEKLRAAHTALYGNDDIGVPYWAWDELETNMILPAKMREIFDAEGLSTADKFQSLDGRAFSTMKKEGFETPSDESIYADSDIIGSAINGAIKALKGAPNAKDHHKTQKGLEGPHGSVHRVAGYPMTKLEISSFSILFYLHHCSVDRLWEGIARAAGKQLLESYTEKDTKDLAPFGKVPSDTWETTVLGYVYDSLPATGDSVVSPKMKARGKELRAKEMSALSLGGKNATKLQATKTYTVTFGKDSGCGSIHLDNPTFDVHFYLVPTAEAADFVFPTTLPTYGDDYFVGTGGFFADSELEGHAVMGVNQPSEYEILPEGDYTVKLQFSPVGCPCSMPNCEIFMQNPLDTGDHDKLLTDDPSTFLCPNLADECGGTFPSLDQLVTLEVSE